MTPDIKHLKIRANEHWYSGLSFNECKITSASRQMKTKNKEYINVEYKKIGEFV
jgi:hypothetical protein